MPAGPSRDQAILDAIAMDPSWLARKVWPRLAGYPDPDACWNWTGARQPRGYGRVGLPGAHRPTVVVHRVVWLAIRGPIDANLVLDHDDPVVGCHTRSCSNPSHLVPATPRENSVVNGTTSVSAAASRATHCPRGHRLGAGNLRPCLAKVGQRGCLTCHREKARAQRELMREAAASLGLTWTTYCKRFGYSTRTAIDLINS